MEFVLRKLIPFVKEESYSESDRIKDSLKDLRLRLDAAKSRFEFASDDTEIEATIYEMESLYVQYRHLLRKAKELRLHCDPIENY